MSEAREYRCDYYTVLAPAKSCLFCDHCTDIFWDYSGPHAFACDIEADTGIGVSGECASFLDDGEASCE